MGFMASEISFKWRYFKKVTINKSGANFAALNEINSVIMLYLSMRLIQIRQIKYLNNIVEQDHRS
jgi:putative transposase